MRVLALLWLLACAMFPSAFAAAGKPSTESWVGCYELWVAPADVKKEVWGELPLWFQLLTKPSGEPLEGAQWFEAKTLNDPLEAPKNWFPPVWKPDSEDVASIDLGNGFVGYSLKIKKSGRALAGTAKPFSDDDITQSTFPFRLVRVACSKAALLTNPTGATNGE